MNLLFSSKQHAFNQRRKDNTNNPAPFLHDLLWQDIHDRLHDIKKSFSRPYYLGNKPPSDFCTALLSSQKITAPLTSAPMTRDPDHLDLPPQSADLILSVFDLHTVNDLPGLLVQIRRVLAPDGVLIAAFPGDDTLYELRYALLHADIEINNGASPRVHPTLTRAQMATLMQRAGFTLPVIDGRRITIEYNDFYKLLHDLRGMGETNTLLTRNLFISRRRVFTHADHIYHSKFLLPTNRIPATFDMIYLIGWGG